MSEREGTMITKLLGHAGWLEGLDDTKRRAIVGRMIAIIIDEKATDREKVGAVKAVAILEKNDIERAKLYLQQLLLDDDKGLSPEAYAMEVGKAFAHMRERDGLDGPTDETKDADTEGSTPAETV